MGHGVTPTALMLIRERGTRCEICGVRPGTEAHHCLFIKSNDPAVNEKYNLQLVCPECHERYGRSYDNRVAFWNEQCRRYGKETMLAWLDRVPYKQKPSEYK